MPKWLVALLALCVVAGYSEQVKCKIGGCQAKVAAHADTATEDGSPACPDEGGDCHCQCHFATLDVVVAPADFLPALSAFSVSYLTWTEAVPEAPCADIEHPPQLA